MNKEIAINNRRTVMYLCSGILDDKDNKSTFKLLVAEVPLSKCNGCWGTPKETIINTSNNNELQKQNIGQRHIESSLKNDSHYENVNITIPSSIPEFNRNHPIPTLDQSITKVKVIENCIALSKKYLDENNFDLAREEAKKGMNSPDCSNLQKIKLVICLSYSSFTFRDCLDAQDAIQSVLVLPECKNYHKIVLFNNSSLILRTIKDYRGAQKAALSGLALTKCISTERIPLLHNLALAYKGLNDTLGQIQVLLVALMNPECNPIQQFTFLFSLSVAYKAIKAEDASIQHLQAALNLKKCKTSLKIHILNFLHKEWTALADDTGAQEALFFSRALANARKKTNVDSSSS